VLLVLFVPDGEVVDRNDTGTVWLANTHHFVFELAAQRCLRYLQAHRTAMTGEVGAHTNRASPGGGVRPSRAIPQ
jgi:hypothetical protein